MEELEDRLALRAARAFDDEDAAFGEDAAAAERVLARLEASPPVALRRRRVRPVVLLAAAAVFVVSIAGAVVGVLEYRKPPPPPAASAASAAAPAIAPPIAPAPIIESPVLPSASVSVAPQVTEPSPSELLSAAGQARRQGQNAQAARLLERLQARYPGSPEALASDITLGNIRLQSGAPSAALAAFDRSLKRSPSGARAADALWGRAQALSALGRAAEAKNALETLLARYPSSPYTSAARAKLRAP
jgi:tetratricopeptide (TPR) repeat protein